MRKIFLAMLLFIFGMSPASIWACACGCGVFDVGTSAMLPTSVGGVAYLEYNYLNQNQNWHEGSKAPAEDNEDREIRSQFYTAGINYMFNRSWGAALDIPYWKRSATMVMDDGMGDEMEATYSDSSLGDIRLRGVYTGFSPDMSTGLTFGIKFPSGRHDYEHFERDMQIGTGSTDLLLGAFHRGNMAASRNWGWFVNAQADLPVLITPDYRPGDEVNATLGAYYDGWKLGAVKIAPVLQTIGSVRWSDTGMDAAHDDSGYKRVLLTPGIELSAASWRLYGDVGFPVYEYVNGNQLVASRLYKVNISRRF